MNNSKKIFKIARGELQDNAVWFMRQAGRYLPDYSVIKGKLTFPEMMEDRKLIEKISFLPLKYFNTDAIVVFTDILVPFLEMGYEVSYGSPITVKKGKSVGMKYYHELSSAIQSISSLRPELTTIGVVGGPFTTFSYLYDQEGSGHSQSKARIVEGDSGELKSLVEELINFAELQVKAGVDVIQIFESWIGSVSENFYDSHLKELEWYFMEKIRELGRPIAFFSEGSLHLLSRILNLDADVYSIDWRTSFSTLRNICNNCIIQGNLDPYLLGAENSYLKSEVLRIMREGREFQGHIFNLGHGVPPWTDFRKLKLISDEVLNYVQ